MNISQAIATVTTLSALLCGCAGPAPSLVQGPVQALPIKPPMNLEHPNNGAIFQGWMSANSLYSGRHAQAIGDTMKVDISENLKASQQQSTDAKRENNIAIKGPGTGGKSGGILNSILNADASASGSDAFKGAGNAAASSSLNTTIAVSVINVLPNGNLVVAGERNLGLNGGRNTLRFSGTLDPRDIRPGNVVSSADVVNSSFEMVGAGDVSEAASRSWLQRVLARSLSIW